METFARIQYMKSNEINLKVFISCFVDSCIFTFTTCLFAFNKLLPLRRDCYVQAPVSAQCSGLKSVKKSLKKKYYVTQGPF